MCIRDSSGRAGAEEAWRSSFLRAPYRRDALIALGAVIETFETCLLYTSDAADERSSVDLGGRRIIKKKKK